MQKQCRTLKVVKAQWTALKAIIGYTGYWKGPIDKRGPVRDSQAALHQSII